MKSSYGVSVIIPAFNSERTISQTLASVAAQDLDNIEIICVDDASTDSTPTVIDNYVQRDKRFKSVYIKHNLGVHLARAEGIKAASYGWIGFLDSDDTVAPVTYKSLLNTALHYDADIVICGSRRITPSGHNLGIKYKPSVLEVFDNLLLKRFCRLEFGTGSLWNKLYRAELIRNWCARSQRWPQNGTEDTLVNIGCFSEAKRVCTLPIVYHFYIQQPGSLTNNLDPAIGFVKIVRAYAMAIDLYAHLGVEAQALIADLYRAQLSFPSYAIPWQDSIPEFLDDLSEPLLFLALNNPQALSLLLARLPTPKQHSFKSRLSSLFNFR